MFLKPLPLPLPLPLAALRQTYATTNWVFDSNILEYVDEYCYLCICIIINSSGTFKRRFEMLFS